MLYLKPTFDVVYRTGNAVKNRWNRMVSMKREDILDHIVMQNASLFRRILQAIQCSFTWQVEQILKSFHRFLVFPFSFVQSWVRNLITILSLCRKLRQTRIYREPQTHVPTVLYINRFNTSIE